MNALLSTSDQYTNTSSKKIVHCNGQYYVHCKYYAQFYTHYNAQYNAQYYASIMHSLMHSLMHIIMHSIMFTAQNWPFL